MLVGLAHVTLPACQCSSTEGERTRSHGMALVALLPVDEMDDIDGGRVDCPRMLHVGIVAQFGREFLDQVFQRAWRSGFDYLVSIVASTAGIRDVLCRCMTPKRSAGMGPRALNRSTASRSAIPAACIQHMLQRRIETMPPSQ